MIGRGVVGLFTVRSLRRRGIECVCVGRETEAETTSAVAGGFWMPFHAEPADAVERWAVETLASYREEAGSAGSVLGPHLEVLPAAQLYPPEATPREVPGWLRAPGLNFAAVSGRAAIRAELQRRGVAEPLVPPGYEHAHVFDTVVADSPRCLEALEAALRADSGVVLVKAALDTAGARALAREHGCDAIVNCAGLGGAALFADAADAAGPSVGGRGVVLSLQRRPGPAAVITADAGPLAPSEAEPAYIIPRGDVVVVGGSYDEADTEPAARPREVDRLLRIARALLPAEALREPPAAAKVGFRPVRHAGVRLDLGTDAESGLVLARNYGHGGSGWTIGPACAEEIAEKLAAC